MKSVKSRVWFQIRVRINGQAHIQVRARVMKHLQRAVSTETTLSQIWNQIDEIS